MAIKPTMVPKSGLIGLLDGQKEQGKRVDFKPDDFIMAIESKGYRLAWARASLCPCRTPNTQSDQPDPNCTLCKGSGWMYYAPTEPVSSVTAGELSEHQQLLIDKYKAGVIRGVMSGAVQKNTPYDPVVSRIEGTMSLTVRPENALGYYDRIIHLDALVVYSQLLEMGEGDTLSTKQPIAAINLLRSVDTIYELELDFSIEAGQIKWAAGKAPAKGESIAISYLANPVWLVVDRPNAFRSTLVKYKTASPETPQGDARALPIKATIQYESIPDDDRD